MNFLEVYQVLIEEEYKRGNIDEGIYNTLKKGVATMVAAGILTAGSGAKNAHASSDSAKGDKPNIEMKSGTEKGNHKLYKKKQLKRSDFETQEEYEDAVEKATSYAKKLKAQQSEES